MTLQEVTDKIIEELYNRKITTTVHISQFCKEIGLNPDYKISSISQKLQNDGYVTPYLTTTGDGLIKLNSNGIDYIEKKREKMEMKENINIPPNLKNKDIEYKTNPIFRGREFSIKDDKCFVLMPFNEENNLQEIYNDQIKTTVENLGFSCVRADNINNIGSIIETIWGNINESKFIIADLTGKNPNVFYELGIAHTIGKDVILLSQNIEDVPFDLRHLRVIPYKTTSRGAEKLTKELSETIKSIVSL